MSIAHVIIPASQGRPVRVEANPLLAPGERGYSYLLKRTKIGDGERPWDELPTFAEDDPVTGDQVDQETLRLIAVEEATRLRDDPLALVNALLNPGL